MRCHDREYTKVWETRTCCFVFAPEAGYDFVHAEANHNRLISDHISAHWRRINNVYGVRDTTPRLSSMKHSLNPLFRAWMRWVHVFSSSKFGGLFNEETAPAH